MRRAIIQVGDNKIAYDGRNWTAIEGERAQLIADLMKMFEWRYEIEANTQPDLLYNIASVAAREFKGEVIECPELPDGPPDRIY